MLGIDIVEHYIEQANFIKRSLGLERVEFRHLDVNAIDALPLKEFDVTFCFGILYHLENPIYTMKKIATVTKQALLVDTLLLD